MSKCINTIADGPLKGHEGRMDRLRDIAKSRHTACAILTVLAAIWHFQIEQVVHKPYLDEYFHVYQAELYLQGLFREWHPKITTPPGLYLVSLTYLGALSLIGFFDYVSVADLRRTNLGAAALIPYYLRFVLRKVTDKYDSMPLTPQASQLLWSEAEFSHAVLNMCLFPPLFFFYGLYYTDVCSVLSVLITFYFFERKRKKSMIAAGFASLFFRQTNIFWVAIYLGGQDVIRNLALETPDLTRRRNITRADVVARSWHCQCLYDPTIRNAHLEDYLKFALSVLMAAITKEKFRGLCHILVPYLALLLGFGLFVGINGGVVLGDKGNHVASIHLAQMLYIWPYIMFFSFPLLFQQLLNAVTPQQYIPSPLRIGSTRHQLPRFVVGLPIMLIMVLIVHFNTIVHPFTLADNRHYVFYVFRLLLRHPSIKYLGVPIYFMFGWAAISAMGGFSNAEPANQISKPRFPLDEQSLTVIDHNLLDWHNIERGHRVSSAFCWLLATTLSLVTAPLVEPRYFIIPWLVWRLHLPSTTKYARSPSAMKDMKHPEKKQTNAFVGWCKVILYEQHDHRLWLETLWFLTVNWAVGYVFLYRGFEWEHEKGKTQRFMW
ncbi:MAG: hypothetical protein Q9222_004188 [Ikaeria aurantiellina]